MTLLIVFFAAIISTVVWYVSEDDRMQVGRLSLMYWGASLMWLVDAIVEYIETGVGYFTPAVSEMLNDAFLGASAVALGMFIWLAALLVRDPSGKIRAMLGN